MPVTLEEVHGPTVLDYFDEHGLTMAALTKQLKRELKAKVTKSIKVKGAVSNEQIGKGRRIVATSGTTIETKDRNSLRRRGNHHRVGRDRLGRAAAGQNGRPQAPRRLSCGEAGDYRSRRRTLERPL